jgi:hypothetical protein
MKTHFSGFRINLRYENTSWVNTVKCLPVGYRIGLHKIYEVRMAIIKEETGREVTQWRHEGAKDLAELNRLVSKVDKSRDFFGDRDRGPSL